MARLTEICGRRVGVVASAGLSSWAVIRLLCSRGVRPHVYWCDVGQQDESCTQSFLDDMEGLQLPIRRLDLRPDVGEFALQIVRCGAFYEGGYWNSTGALRYLLLRRIVPQMQDDGCEVLAHGCVGGGNDEQRFRNYTAALGHGMVPFSPFLDAEVQERFSSRDGMVDFIRQEGVAAELDHKRRTSTDGSAIGTSYEGRDLESVGDDFANFQPAMSKLPWDASDHATTVTLIFEKGRPHFVGEDGDSDYDILDRANRIAGAHGVSLRTVVENRISDTKCKGVYESPGMDLLWFAFSNLAQLVWSKETQQLHRKLRRDLGLALYQGQMCRLDSKVMLGVLDRLASQVSGQVQVRVYRGNLHCVGMHAEPSDLIQQRRFLSGELTWADRNMGAGAHLLGG